MIDTFVTVDTFVFFYLYTEEGKFVEQSVQCAKWAKETAEETEDKYTSYHDTHHEKELPCKDWSKH